MAESDLHRAAKEQMAEAFKDSPFCKNCAIERIVGDVRPDISLRINNDPVAVEIQISSISTDEIYARTASYTKKGIYLLWVTPMIDEFTDGESFRVPEWMRVLHGFYFGRIFAWIGGLSVWPVKLERVEHFKEGGFDIYGDEHPDTTYTPKTMRRPVLSSRHLHIDSDFEKFNRKQWSGGGGIVIPPAKLWNAQFDAIKWQGYR